MLAQRALLAVHHGGAAAERVAALVLGRVATLLHVCMEVEVQAVAEGVVNLQGGRERQQESTQAITAASG